jgi:predicted nuclease with TOPRIM domain
MKGLAMVRNIPKMIDQKKQELNQKLKEVKAIREEIKELKYNTLPTKEELEEIFKAIEYEYVDGKKFIQKPATKLWKKAKEFFPALTAHDINRIFTIHTKTLKVNDKIIRGVEL